MTVGEYASMKAMRNALSEFVPEPMGCGSYASNPSIYFFIYELANMTDEIPEIQAFVRLLAELEWYDTWEEAFHHSMKWFVYTEKKSQGTDDEMRELCEGLFEKVIPCLLRPLETGGRQIQPRLIHGDLWSGSTSTNIDTNTPVVYDGAYLYAHNESWYLIHLLLMCKNNEANQTFVPLEMAAWRPIHHKIGRHYMKAYFDYFPISASEEDQDDHNFLYYL